MAMPHSEFALRIANRRTKVCNAYYASPGERLSVAGRGDTKGVGRQFRAPSVIRAKRGIASVPTHQHDVAILYSGDVRTFVNPEVRDPTVTKIVQPLLQAGVVITNQQIVNFQPSPDLHSCPRGYGWVVVFSLSDCGSVYNKLSDPEYFSSRISEPDVQRVVDSLYANNTVQWLHPSCCGPHRVVMPTVATMAAGLDRPSDCPFCEHTGELPFYSRSSSMYIILLYWEAHASSHASRK
eukprot:6674861-Pyramimonas_sp.AAC.2